MPAVARSGAPREDAPRVDVRAERTVVASVAVRGAPGSLEVVGVPVPAAFDAAAVVRYRVSAEGRARVVGNTSGMLTAGPARRASIFFTVSAPTTAGAGRVHVATAEFDAPGATTIAVPVEMLVAPTHRVEVAVLDQMVGARAGGVVPIRVRAVNFGNQPDTVRLAVTPPQGWRVTSSTGDAAIAVPVRGARETVLRVWVPPSHPAGLALVRIVATLQGAPVASTDVQVQVGGERGGASTGPWAQPELHQRCRARRADRHRFRRRARWCDHRDRASQRPRDMDGRRHVERRSAGELRPRRDLERPADA